MMKYTVVFLLLIGGLLGLAAPVVMSGHASGVSPDKGARKVQEDSDCECSTSTPEGVVDEGETEVSAGPPIHYRIVISNEGHSVEKVPEAEVVNEGETAVSAQVMEASSGTVELTPECTTDGTSWSGARRSCTSAWSVVTAPPNYVFNERSLSKSLRHENGSPRVDHEWHDYVEVIPGTGIKAPRTLKARSHARSPGCRGCRGWAKALVTATYVQYRQ